MQGSAAMTLDAGVPTDAIDYPTEPDKSAELTNVQRNMITVLRPWVLMQRHLNAPAPDKIACANALYVSGWSAETLIENIDVVMANLARQP